MDLLGEPYRHAQAVRRATTATSILDVGAWIGLFAGCIFWNNFFWFFIAPTSPFDMVLAVAIAAGYAVILPMLISLLAPSTPAGMALAETRWRTIGHGIAVAAAIFMSYHAFLVLWAWWRARPAAVAAQQDLFLAIGTAIVMIVVPALAWVQVAPDRWVAEIVQAQQVRRLRAAQQANLMAAQIQYARAMALLKRGLANATVGERAELAGTLIAMQRAENEAISQVADQLRIVTGIDTGVQLLDDPQLETHYHQLTNGLERLIAPMNEADYVTVPTEPHPARRAVVDATSGGGVADAAADQRGAHQNAIPATAAIVAAAPTATRGGPRRAAAELAAVAAEYPPPKLFAAKDVAKVIGKSERTARDVIAAWVDEGWVARGDLPGGYFILREG
jgi:hypothetical protein